MTSESRSLRTIAMEIKKEWNPVNHAAKPYLLAMSTLDKMTDQYGMDSAYSIVQHFLSNSSTWRGEAARRIKAELKQMLKGAK